MPRLPTSTLRRRFTRPSTALAVIEGLGTRLILEYFIYTEYAFAWAHYNAHPLVHLSLPTSLTWVNFPGYLRFCSHSIMSTSPSCFLLKHTPGLPPSLSPYLEWEESRLWKYTCILWLMPAVLSFRLSYSQPICRLLWRLWRRRESVLAPVWWWRHVWMWVVPWRRETHVMWHCFVAKLK